MKSESQREGEIVGKRGIGTRNERGERWIEWCGANAHVITNTWFKEHPKRLRTCKSPGDNVRNQIDYSTIKKRFRSAVLQSESYPGTVCGSDHVSVVCEIKVRLRRLKKSKIQPKLDLNSLNVSSGT